MPNDKVTITVEVDGKQVVVSLNNISEAFKKLGSTITSAAQPATQQLADLNKNVQHVGDSLTGTIIKANLFTAAFQTAFNMVKDAVVTTTLYAARTQVLGTVLDSVAKANHLNTIAVRDQVEVMKSLGITTQEARQSVTRMIQAQLDVSKATQLARVAQDAAVIANVNSSEALQRLLHGITTFQPEILRTLGIIVTSQEAFEKYAVANGLAANALTATQKQAAFMNAVIERGSTIAGTYESAMGDVGKQLTSMKRFQEEAANAIGQQFLPVLSMGVQVLTAFFKIIAQSPEVVTLLSGAVLTLTGSFVALNTQAVASTVLFGRSLLAALTNVGRAMLFVNGVTLAGVAGWVGIGLAVAAAVAAFVDFSDAAEKASAITADQRVKNLDNIKTLQAQYGEMQRVTAAYENNENVTKQLEAAQAGLDTVTRATIGTWNNLGDEINATTKALKANLDTQKELAAASLQTKIAGIADAYQKMADATRKASDSAKALSQGSLPGGLDALTRDPLAVLGGRFLASKDEVTQRLKDSTAAAEKNSAVVKQLASDILAYGRALGVSTGDLVEMIRRTGASEQTVSALREEITALATSLNDLNRVPFDWAQALEDSLMAAVTQMQRAQQIREAGFLTKGQRDFLKDLGIPTVQEARERLNLVIRGIEEAAKNTGKTVAELAQAKPAILNQLFQEFSRQASEAKKAAEEAKRHAEALRKIDEAIRELGKPKLSGLAAELASLDEQFRRIEQMNPTRQQLELARATLESAKVTAILNAQLELEVKAHEAIDKAIRARLAETADASARELKEAFKAAQEAEEEQANTAKRVRLLQQEVELLRTRVGFGTATSDAAREQSELVQMQVRHQQELNNALFDGLSLEEQTLIKERQQLELIDLQQEQYRQLYDDLEEQAGRVFDAITAKGKSGFQGLVDYIQGLWLTAMRKMFAEAVASLLTPMFARLRDIFSLGGGTQGVGAGGVPGIGALPSLIPSIGGIGIPGLGSARTPPFIAAGQLPATLGGLVGPGTFGAAAGSLAGVGELALPATFASPLTTAGSALGAAGGAGAGAGGGFTATHGLFGVSFAKLGAFFTNPITIGVGAAIGGFLLWNKLRKTREDKFQAEILRDFGLSIPDKQVLNQIKDIGESTFGKEADSKRYETLRLDTVQGLLLDYAVRTGQNPAQLPLYQRFYGRGIPAPPVSLNTSTGGILGLNQAKIGSVTGNQSNSFNISVDARGATNPDAIGRGVATVLEKTLRQNYRRQRIADSLFGTT